MRSAGVRSRRSARAAASLPGVVPRILAVVLSRGSASIGSLYAFADWPPPPVPLPQLLGEGDRGWGPLRLRGRDREAGGVDLAVPIRSVTRRHRTIPAHAARCNCVQCYCGMILMLESLSLASP